MTDEEKAIQKKSNEYLLDHFTQTFRDCVHEDILTHLEQSYANGYKDGLAEGRKELEKENAGLKQILYKLVNAFNDYKCAGPEQEQENTWEILRDLMHEELFKLTTRI